MTPTGPSTPGEALAPPRAEQYPDGAPFDPTVLTLGAGVAVLFGWLLESSEQTMLVLVLCALAVLLWPRSRLRATARTRASFLLALGMVTVGVKDDVGRLFEGEVRVWNVYHYYLGAKYFPELGYHDLYLATLAADREADGVFEPHVEKIRSLRTYEVRRLTDEDRAYDPSEHFQPARWEEFKHDVSALAEHRSPRGWRNVFRDRGYNGTPTWTAMGRAITAWLPADATGLVLLASLDLLLLPLTAFVVLRTFGPSAATAVLLLFVASPTNVARLVGGFLQTDWLCAVVLGACLLQRRRYGWAAVALAFATTTRLFPAVLVATAIAPVFFDTLRNRTWRLSSGWRRFLLVFVASSLFAVGIGIIGNGRGADGWTEFARAISVHRTTHVLGDRRIGLEHAFTRSNAALDEGTPDAERQALLEQRHGAYLTCAALLLALSALALRRLRPPAATAFGMIPIFAVTVSSRYYFGLLALLPLVASSRFAQAAQLVPFALYYALVRAGADDHTAYAWLNGFLAIYFCGLAVAVAAHRSSNDAADLEADRPAVGSH